MSQSKSGNFDVQHELDEFMMAEKPLAPSKRKESPDGSKQSPELRELESQCVVTPV
jgi:serine/threonine kinase 32